MSLSALKFWTRVMVGFDDECWPWHGPKFHFGHGAAHFEGEQDRAHRVSWRLMRGPIPPKMCVLHSCDNPPCVNPAHLFIGTKSMNGKDRHQKGRSARGFKARMGNRGTHNPNAKLTPMHVERIKAARKSGRTLTDIASEFGVTFSHVHRIVNGKAWSH